MISTLLAISIFASVATPILAVNRLLERHRL